LGNAQRLGLAKSLIHYPDILILDEPANGLDPAGIVEIRELLKDLAINKGVTVFISSHILGEISKFATRIGIIHEGKLVHESSIQEMVNLRKVCLQLKTNDIQEAKNHLENNGYFPSLTDDGILEITSLKAITNPEIIATLLVKEGFPPNLLKVEEEDLETFFLRVINMKGGAQ
jgi:ABC-2 type transport system ATP-binding protein